MRSTRQRLAAMLAAPAILIIAAGCSSGGKDNGGTTTNTTPATSASSPTSSSSSRPKTIDLKSITDPCKGVTPAVLQPLGLTTQGVPGTDTQNPNTKKCDINSADSGPKLSAGV